METPQIPFKVFLIQDGVLATEPSGGSYDNISAVTIACALYQSLQGYNPATENAVTVHDETDTAIAYVGRHPEAQHAVE